MRAAFYGRVSTEEQMRGFSTRDQETGGRALIAQRGWDLVDVYIDEGESAKTFDRTNWRRLQRDAQAGKFDVVVFDRIDRISRATVLDALMTIDAFRKYGVAFVSVSEPLDFTHPAGEIMLMLLLWFARQFLVNLSRVVTRGRESRARSGLSNANRPPFGYKRVDGLDVPDPLTRETARELFLRAASPTETALTLTRWLNSTGHTMVSGKAFTRAAVQAMLRNRFYSGYVIYRGLREALVDTQRKAWKDAEWIKGKHEAIISEDEFARAAAATARRRLVSSAPRRNKDAAIYMLRGLVVCAHCGARMHGSRNRHGRARYTCSAGFDGNPCQAHARLVSESVIAADVDALIDSLAIGADVLRSAEHMASAEPTAAATESRRITEIDEELARLDHMYRKGRIAQEKYDRDVDALTTERTALSQIKPMPQDRVVAHIASLADAWRTITLPDARRAILAALIEHAEIDILARRIVRWKPTADFVQVFTAAGVPM